ETALDKGLIGPGSHEDRIGPAPDQELQGLHQKGLAGTGLTGERRHARLEIEGDGFDDAQVLHPEFDEHGRRRRADQRSARWNLDRKMEWKSRSPRETRRAF